MTSSTKTVLSWAALATAVVVAACSEEKIAPAPVDATTSSSSTGGSDGTGGGAVTPPEARIRTVETRSPWGGAIGNLFVDGDFEFSVVLQGASPQAGWFAFGNNSQGYVLSLIHI